MKTADSAIVKMVTGVVKRPGIYLIASRPGVGKTTLALNIFYEALLQKVPSLYITLDTSIRRIQKILLAMESGTPVHDLVYRERDFHEDHVRTLESASMRVLSYPHTMLEIPMERGHVIPEKLEEFVSGSGSQFVFIDPAPIYYMQNGEYIVPHPLRAVKVLRELRYKAEKLGVTLVLTWPFNRKSRYRENSPSSRDLFGGEKICRIADACLLLHSPESKGFRMRVIDSEGSTRGDFRLYKQVSWRLIVTG